MSFGYDGAVNPTPYLLAWQRLQRLHLSDGDIRLTTASGWAATVAAPSAAQPGAILLQSSDISSATGLDPRAVSRALAAPAVDVRVRFHLQQTIMRTPRPARFHLSAKARRQALKVESLDRGATLPPGFPGTSVWDTLAQCEAGGDWGADTGNGFFGGLQFTSSTWLENGGGTYAPSISSVVSQYADPAVGATWYQYEPRHEIGCKVLHSYTGRFWTVPGA